MHTTLGSEAFAGTLAERLAHHGAAGVGSGAAGKPGLQLYWLGQAGFVIDSAHGRFVVDPYLSDSLAHKYRGTHFPHTRMMAAPIAPEELADLDYVLCTHRHTDHMDPGTLQPLAQGHPGLRFVVPQASELEAQKRCGVGSQRLMLADSERTLVLPLAGDAPPARLHGLASAHESLQTDAQGHSEWLGYVLEVDGLRIYHSGDCVPYPALAQRLQALAIDVALLPVNGRDSERLDNGVPGNFTLQEAVDLAVDANIPHLIAHHHGLFAFSTLAPQEIDAQIPVAAARGLQLVRARTGCCFVLAPTAPDKPPL